MASNPMQRQARNSFLLGMVLTMIIAGAIIVFLFMQMNKIQEEKKQITDSKTSVYVLKQSVKSGNVLTSDMFEKIEIYTKEAKKIGALDSSVISQQALCTTDGTNIKATVTKEGETKLVLEDGNSSEVKTDEVTGKYYIADSSASDGKKYIETTTKPYVAKVDLDANSVLVSSMITRSDEMVSDDVRKQEYNMLVLPVDLTTGDYIDVRLQLPSGQDYIVISKKLVTIPNVNGEFLADTIQMNLAEQEILTMSNAIVEAYKIDGSKLYVTKYTDAGMQSASIPTYVVSQAVASLIEADSNIVSRAMKELGQRYNANNGKVKDLRSKDIENALSTNGKDENVPTKVQESITSTQEARKQYLQSLSGGATN